MIKLEKKDCYYVLHFDHEEIQHYADVEELIFDICKNYDKDFGFEYVVKYIDAKSVRFRVKNNGDNQ